MQNPFSLIQKDISRIQLNLSSLFTQDPCLNPEKNDILRIARTYVLLPKACVLYGGLTALMGYTAMNELGFSTLLSDRNSSSDRISIMGNAPLSDSTTWCPSFHLHLELSQIVSMIYASYEIHLLVDDSASAHNVYGSIQQWNRIAVLSGDYILSRVSHRLSHLNSLPTVCHLTRAVEDLSTGHFDAFSGSVMDSSTYQHYAHRVAGSLLEHSFSATIVLLKKLFLSGSTMRLQHHSPGSPEPGSGVDFDSLETLTGEIGRTYGKALRIAHEIQELTHRRRSVNTDTIADDDRKAFEPIASPNSVEFDVLTDRDSALGGIIRKQSHPELLLCTHILAESDKRVSSFLLEHAHHSDSSKCLPSGTMDRVTAQQALDVEHIWFCIRTQSDILQEAQSRGRTCFQEAMTKLDRLPATHAREVLRSAMKYAVSSLFTVT